MVVVVVCVLADEYGELVPLMLADRDVAAGTTTLAIQTMGTFSNFLVFKLPI
ncbi:MAG: hypothetical protein LBJ43_01585 [Propionibacteriaceae bacterium]|nr:hypothetical protein [Propionibacteriaceae bacterium]